MSQLPPAAPPPLPPAALVYPTGNAEALPLAGFAEELKTRGFRVGGLVQTIERDAEGYKQSITGIDVGTGEATILARYQGDRRVDANCGFDVAALAAATRAVRGAMANDADLIVIEKFGRHEGEGGGLRDEILGALAAGIPTVTAVSSTVLGEWSAMLGGLDVYLPATRDALWKWWGPHRLYDDLERGVGEGTAQRVVVGFNWTLVEGEHGCGIAQTPNRGKAGCEAVPGAGSFVGKPLRELARLVHSWNPAEAAVGLAAINAFYNRFDLSGDEGNGLDALAPPGRPGYRHRPFRRIAGPPARVPDRGARTVGRRLSGACRRMVAARGRGRGHHVVRVGRPRPARTAGRGGGQDDRAGRSDDPP